jgi:hypothetical protein
LALAEMEGGPEDVHGRMARNFTNFVEGHDPARGTSHDHSDVYDCFRKEPDLNGAGKAIADKVYETFESGNEPLHYERSRQNVMFRRVGKHVEYVFMESFRSMRQHALNLRQQFHREETESGQNPSSPPPAPQHIEACPLGGPKPVLAA